MNIIRRLRRLLKAKEKTEFSTSVHRAMADKAYWAVNTFYVVNLFFAYQTMYLLMDAYGQPEATRLAIEPLWPVFFSNSQTIPLVANGVSLFYMMSSLLAAIWPHKRWVRLLAFTAMLQAFAFKYSFGVFKQKELWWIWTSLILIFLPSSKLENIQKSRSMRQCYLDIFSLAQGTTLFFYFMCGWWKIYYGVSDLRVGGHHGIFWPESLAYIVINRMVTSHYIPFLAPVINNYPTIGCPAFLLVTYIEIFSLVIWFRPALHKLWGIMLILFHIGTWLIMGIVFYLQPPLLAVLFLMSPFAPEKVTCKSAILQLPLIGSLIVLIQRLVRQYINHRNPASSQ